MHSVLILVALAAVSFVQNAAFAAVSRSRNSGDVAHHAKWSVASNGVWFATQILVFSTVWKAIESGSYSLIAAAGVVYVAATTAGSCWMMAKMLKTETGKRMVGAR
ncbi:MULTISPECIES: hypothetical protein [unclassified Bradyrhizobium]|uniref:hypothetical protein n=1 Tax=unclassified Bradyrhizobium TaxID=2631580 RepID=UPI002FF0FB5D